MRIKKILDGFIILAIGFSLGTVAWSLYWNHRTWSARIVVTDSKGNLVKGKKPSVVCLAESPKENLICRVERVE